MSRFWQLVADIRVAISVICAFALMLVGGSLLVYRFDQYDPTVFPSLGEAIWWGFTVAATPGWGVHEPNSLPGRIGGGILQFLGAD